MISVFTTLSSLFNSVGNFFSIIYSRYNIWAFVLFGFVIWSVYRFLLSPIFTAVSSDTIYNMRSTGKRRSK